MIGNKITDKITLIGTSKEKEKQRKQKKLTFHQEKQNKLLMTLNCFEYKMWRCCIKIEFQKIVNLSDTTFDDNDLPRFVTRKWIKVYDQSEKKITMLTKKLELKHQC